MGERLKDLLSLVDSRSLYGAAEPKQLAALGKLVDGGLSSSALASDPNRVADLVLAYYGTSCLELQQVRQAR